MVFVISFLSGKLNPQWAVRGWGWGSLSRGNVSLSRQWLAGWLAGAPTPHPVQRSSCVSRYKLCVGQGCLCALLASGCPHCEAGGWLRSWAFIPNWVTQQGSSNAEADVPFPSRQCNLHSSITCYDKLRSCSSPTRFLSGASSLCFIISETAFHLSLCLLHLIHMMPLKHRPSQLLECVTLCLFVYMLPGPVATYQQY